MQNLAKAAEKAGLPFQPYDRVYNSRPAQELGTWAASQNCGEAFHKAVFSAYFAEKKNISDPKVLVDLASALSLSRDAAMNVLTEKTFRSAVDSDWARARELEIRILPTFVVGEYRLVGAQSYESMENWLRRRGVEKR